AEILLRAGAESGQIRFHVWPTDRGWLRDSLPTFVVRDGEPDPLELGLSSNRGAICWKFNAWAKYENHVNDERLPRRVAKAYSIDRIKPVAMFADETRRVVLEGGAIDCNGLGVLLTTEECLLSEIQCRNPGLTKNDYNALFAETLGIRQTIWLGRGIAGDDTHGHVDDLARFVSTDTVVTVVEQDKADENYEPLRENLKRLKSVRIGGKPLNVVELPMPRPVVFDGQRLPASYANFYIANKVVLVPTFNDPADRVALEILAGLFPGRNVIGIHAVDLVWGLGTLHCLAHEMPAVAALEEPEEAKPARSRRNTQGRSQTAVESEESPEQSIE
ncbi:MAG: agmatine/peptidylarginine deiminase, partial [bacterium]